VSKKRHHVQSSFYGCLTLEEEEEREGRTGAKGMAGLICLGSSGFALKGESPVPLCKHALGTSLAALSLDMDSDKYECFKKQKRGRQRMVKHSQTPVGGGWFWWLGRSYPPKLFYVELPRRKKM